MPHSDSLELAYAELAPLAVEPQDPETAAWSKVAAMAYQLEQELTSY